MDGHGHRWYQLQRIFFISDEYDNMHVAWGCWVAGTLEPDLLAIAYLPRIVKEKSLNR